MRHSSRASLRASLLTVSVLSAGLTVSGCMGRVDPGPGSGQSPPGASSGSGSGSGSGGSSGGSSGSSSGGSSGSSSGGVSSSSSSGGSPGDPDCSELAVPDLAKVCPDGTSVGGQYVVSNHQCVLEFPCPTPLNLCEQGSTCSPNTACITSEPTPSGCAASCTCDSTGHNQCTLMCSNPPPPTGCFQGSACSQGEGCGTAGSSPDSCSTTCNCNSSGFFDCTTSCEDAGPPPVLTDPCPDLALPDICEVCSNGTTECAHAILVMGQCQVEICPGGS
ncbi:MAG TPA: hypothetical protein VK762_18630 [Polyangiaceae bacterium]|nr:hypothetical protein [Polyangiaceae bacterium]